MEADTLAAIAGFVGVAATVTTGGLAYLAARKSALAATESARAANLLTQIEHDRWHQDLTPQVEAKVTEFPQQGRALLRVRYRGPSLLDRLTVTISLRDDDETHEAGLAGGPTAEQVAAVIWGPFRFERHVDKGSEDGRSAGPFDLALGDWRPVSLRPSIPPAWATENAWRDKYDEDAPVRLTVTCEHPGYKPWKIYLEVLPDVEYPA